MAGMRALGRVYNPVFGGTSATEVQLKGCSGVGVLALASSTATTSLAVVAATSYGGSTTNWTSANGFNQPTVWYQQTAAGTAAWTKQTASWATSTLTIGATSGYVSYVDFLVAELADTYDYIKITPTNCTIVLLPYDLTVQRTPPNLAIISA
jgi:hypothetical protein